jgi:hypothetical protein
MTDATDRDTAIQQRIRQRYSEPGLLERGYAILARMAAQNALAVSLAAEFEAAWKDENAVANDDNKTNEELDAAVDRTAEIADRILALSGADHLPTIQLKGRVYLWAQSEPLESLSSHAQCTNEKALVSLLRDLGADRPSAQIIEEARS